MALNYIRVECRLVFDCGHVRVWEEHGVVEEFEGIGPMNLTCNPRVPIRNLPSQVAMHKVTRPPGPRDRGPGLEEACAGHFGSVSVSDESHEYVAIENCAGPCHDIVT